MFQPHCFHQFFGINLLFISLDLLFNETIYRGVHSVFEVVGTIEWTGMLQIKPIMDYFRGQRSCSQRDSSFVNFQLLVTL
jgi:hypothetical protein